MARTNKYPQPKKKKVTDQRIPFKKNEKKPEKGSLKKQLERKAYYPKTLEEMGNHHGFIEYQMNKELAKDILLNRFGKERGADPQKYLCDFVNDQFGLLGYCIRVIVA